MAITTGDHQPQRAASAKGVELAALPLTELQAAHPKFEADISDWLDPARAVDRRDLPGGPARTRVLAEIDRISRDLGVQPPA